MNIPVSFPPSGRALLTIWSERRPLQKVVPGVIDGVVVGTSPLAVKENEDLVFDWVVETVAVYSIAVKPNRPNLIEIERYEPEGGAVEYSTSEGAGATASPYRPTAIAGHIP